MLLLWVQGVCGKAHQAGVRVSNRARLNQGRFALACMRHHLVHSGELCQLEKRHDLRCSQVDVSLGIGIQSLLGREPIALSGLVIIVFGLLMGRHQGDKEARIKALVHHGWGFGCDPP